MDSFLNNIVSMLSQCKNEVIRQSAINDMHYRFVAFPSVLFLHTLHIFPAQPLTFYDGYGIVI